MPFRNKCEEGKKGHDTEIGKQNNVCTNVTKHESPSWACHPHFHETIAFNPKSTNHTLQKGPISFRDILIWTSLWKQLLNVDRSHVGLSPHCYPLLRHRHKLQRKWILHTEKTDLLFTGVKSELWASNTWQEEVTTRWLVYQFYWKKTKCCVGGLMFYRFSANWSTVWVSE